MKHWDHDAADVQPLRLSQRERQRVRAAFERPANRRPERAHMGSLIGLALALGMLAGLAWVLSPSSPVSPDVLN